MTDNYKLVWECINGGKVYLHPTHFEEELEENLFFAKCLAQKGKVVYLMPFYHSFQMKNPDATINGRLVDFKFPKKTVNWHNAIQTHIRNANRQGAAIVVIYFERDDIDRNQIARGLSTALQDRLLNFCFKAKKAIRKDSFFRSNAPVGHIRRYKDNHLCKNNKVIFT